MGGVAERPFPPGDYDVVVVGSGPGGLQTAYFLSRLGVSHALLSADEKPGGMFRFWPIFQRLLSWSKPDAPFPPATREYEWYDHNSLLAEEPEHRALVPQLMDRRYVVPSRAEMEAGLAAFAERTGTTARYGCRWEATRREPDGRLALETSDGVYRCRAAVFAVGVTEPWKPDAPGIEHVPHYGETGDPRSYAGQRVLVIGKRNSGFEIADALLPWARQIVLTSPRPVQTEVLAQASVRVRYFQPLEDQALGGGTLVIDAAMERIERTEEGYVAVVQGTSCGELRIETDAAIAATGFRTPLGDLRELGVATVSRDRIPALTPFFESTSAPNVFFAGNATQGARGLRKDGVAPASPAVHGHRYNARVLAEHLAERLGVRARPRRAVDPAELVPFLAHELAHAPELWAQKGYLARVVTLAGEGGPLDEGILPLEHFVDQAGPDAIAVTVELDSAGRLYPGAYLRRGGRLREVALDPHPVNAFAGPAYRRELGLLLGSGRRVLGSPQDRRG